MPRSWALVTGASRGIGRAIAARLCDEGHHVIAVARDQSRLEELGETCGRDRVSAYVADLEEPGAVSALIAHVTSEHRGLRIIVNNAAMVQHVPFAQTTDELWQRTLHLNLLTPITLVRGLADHLKAPASVVNVGSILGTLPSRSASPYMVAKGGLHHATRVLALELADRGIRVNAVAPGFIATDMFSSSRSPEAQARIGRAHPLGRPGRVEEVAAAVSFLSSDDASFITGAILPVDGGLATQLSVTDLDGGDS